MPALKLAANHYAEGAAILRRLPGRKSVVKDPAEPNGPPLWIVHPSQRAAAERQLRAAGVSYQLVAPRLPVASVDMAVAGDGDGGA